MKESIIRACIFFPAFTYLFLTNAQTSTFSGVFTFLFAVLGARYFAFGIAALFKENK